MNKKETIELINKIRGGSGIPNRDSYPKVWRGSIAESDWNNSNFHYGMEYGYILALMHNFNLTQGEVDNYER